MSALTAPPKKRSEAMYYKRGSEEISVKPFEPRSAVAFPHWAPRQASFISNVREQEAEEELEKLVAEEKLSQRELDDARALMASDTQILAHVWADLQDKEKVDSLIARGRLTPEAVDKMRAAGMSNREIQEQEQAMEMLSELVDKKVLSEETVARELDKGTPSVKILTEVQAAQELRNFLADKTLTKEEWAGMRGRGMSATQIRDEVLARKALDKMVDDGVLSQKDLTGMLAAGMLYEEALTKARFELIRKRTQYEKPFDSSLLFPHTRWPNQNMQRNSR